MNNTMGIYVCIYNTDIGSPGSNILPSVPSHKNKKKEESQCL